MSRVPCPYSWQRAFKVNICIASNSNLAQLTGRCAGFAIYFPHGHRKRQAMRVLMWTDTWRGKPEERGATGRAGKGSGAWWHPRWSPVDHYCPGALALLSWQPGCLAHRAGPPHTRDLAVCRLLLPQPARHEKFFLVPGQPTKWQSAETHQAASGAEKGGQGTLPAAARSGLQRTDNRPLGKNDPEPPTAKAGNAACVLRNSHSLRSWGKITRWYQTLRPQIRNQNVFTC